jgi:hypothetical protein
MTKNNDRPADTLLMISVAKNPFCIHPTG